MILMKTIYTTNVNGALRRGLRYLRLEGTHEDSRNGPVLVAPGPVTTVYSQPDQRVLFGAARDANPFFHLFESLWMLGGRNDVAYPAAFAAQLQLYSDDNETLNGAYGFRWRHHFGYDQLQLIIEELKTNPASRRCVLAMWDAHDEGGDMSPGYEGDLKRALAGGKDVPCNTHVYFRAFRETLDMTIVNRSNDVVWGAYGANAVHFSMLQEYVAGRVGLKLGRMYQFSNNYHVYTGREDVERLFRAHENDVSDDMYKRGCASACPLYSAAKGWDEDLRRFLAAPPILELYEFAPARTTFFEDIVVPMHSAYSIYKKKDSPRAAENFLRAAPFSDQADWLVAGVRWMKRRADKREAKAAQEHGAGTVG